MGWQAARNVVMSYTPVLTVAALVISSGHASRVPELLIGPGQAGAPHCGTIRQAGQYGFSLDGVTNGSPLAAVGQIDLDGTGDAALVGYLTVNGVTSAIQYYGAYQVKEDCSATISFHSSEEDVELRGQFIESGMRFAFLLVSQLPEGTEEGSSFGAREEAVTSDELETGVTALGYATRIRWK